MEITYNYYLVALSYLIASYAAYSALTLSRRIIFSEHKIFWLLSGAASLGSGIWSMHFVGMLAYEMDMPMSYDAGLTTLSGIISLLASGLAIYLIGWKPLNNKIIIVGGTIIGLGISSMHYIGMAAMKMPATISYDNFLFSASILIGIVAAIAALWISHFLAQNNEKHRQFYKLIAALVMGIAICGMHYTGMEAAIYTPIKDKNISLDSFDHTILIGTVTIITILLITSSLIASLDGHNRQHKNNTMLLVLNILTTVTITLGVTVNILYDTAYNAEKTHLDETISSYKNLVRSVSQFDAMHSQDAHSEGARSATILQVKNAHTKFEYESKDNHFFLFEKDKNQKKINFLIMESPSTDFASSEFSVDKKHLPVFNTALDGNNGISNALHPVSHEQILSAYAYIPELNVAILTAISINKIREPFFNALIYTVLVALILIVIATLITVGLNQPVIHSLKNEIDSRSKSEQELRNLTDNLENIVKERTTELEQALILTEDAARSKSEFLANMSHEIRTPMNGVLGMLEMLKDSSLNHEQKDFVSTAYNSAGTLLTIINDILDFSKIEAGAIELESIDFNLQDTIDDVASLLAESAHKKGIELLTLVASNIPVMINSDPTRLRQILFNLVNNAIKFTDHGEVLINVKLDEKNDNQLRIHFEVSDTGIGISQHALETIFDVFKQEDGTTTRKFGGTGLGLSISKKLCQYMGGDLQVKSSPGSGSRFYFSIDAGISPEQPDSQRQSEILHDLKVLIVDDNSTNRKILESMMRSWNISYDSRADGKACLELLTKSPDKYNLLLLDMMMPDLNGLDVINEIKKNNALNNLKILLLTSLTSDNIIEKSKQAGVDNCLHKPIKKSLLLDTIMSLFSDHPLTEQPVDEKQTRIDNKPKLLVAEDNLVNQKVISKMLSYLGYPHDIADNGQQAVEAIKNHKYTLVLMDVQMPVMDGYAATRTIRQLDTEIPAIIAMTANAMEGDREKCLSEGMDDYLSKPINKDSLQNIIQKWTQ